MFLACLKRTQIEACRLAETSLHQECDRVQGCWRDLFVHHTGIAGSGFKSLEEGEKVTYEVTQGRKGLQAVNVSKGPARRPDIRK